LLAFAFQSCRSSRTSRANFAMNPTTAPPCSAAAGYRERWADLEIIVCRRDLALMASFCRGERGRVL
jgi:hypothetical protein